MVHAKRNSRLGREYTLTRDGRKIGTFSLRMGRTGARLRVDGTGYTVRTHLFNGIYELLAGDGKVLASTTRIGRSWTLHAPGQDRRFRQTAVLGREYTMLTADGAEAGTISRSGLADAEASAELRDLKPELEVFALVAVLLRQRRRRAVAIRGGAASGG